MRFLWIALFICFTCVPADAQMLKGGIQEWAKPGAQWQQPESNNYNWFIIPAWLAGNWHYEGIGQFRDGSFRERIGPESAKYDLTWGTQQDKLNDVWHLDLVPQTDKVEKADCQQNVVNLGREPLSSDATTFHYSKKAICVTVVNGRVTRSTPIDAEIRVVRTGKNTIVQQNHVIRPDGVHEYTLIRGTRVGPFQAVEADSDGHNLRRALADYLVENGMPGRVPAE